MVKVKHLRLAVVDSRTDPRLLSLRLSAGQDSATALKRGLRDAGFKAGDDVVLVDAEWLAAATDVLSAKR